MKTKIFPPPAPPYSALDDVERLEQEAAAIDNYPWSARALGVLAGMVFWGLVFMFFLGYLPGDVHDLDTYLAIGSIGSALSFVFSVPFLCK